MYNNSKEQESKSRLASMGALVFKELRSAREVEAFLDRVENYTSVRLPDSYVAKSRIIGVYQGAKLVSGYMLITKPEFRSIEFLPDQVREEHNVLQKELNEFVEVNGMWIGPGVKSPREQFNIWLMLMRDVLLCRKKYLLLMSDKRNLTIKRIHSLTNPTILYEGPPRLFDGAESHKEIRVGYTTRLSVMENLPLYINEYKIREARASSRRISRHSR